MPPIGHMDWIGFGKLDPRPTPTCTSQLGHIFYRPSISLATTLTSYIRRLRSELRIIVHDKLYNAINNINNYGVYLAAAGTDILIPRQRTPDRENH